MLQVDDRVRTIEAYTYDRYVRGARVSPIDESEAVRFLDDYYSKPARRKDPNCGYAGILWFEVSFQDTEDEPRACLERARELLLRAREVSTAPWEAIEERLTDIEDMLSD